LRNLIVIGQFWEQKLLFLVRKLWLEWFESPKCHLASRKHFLNEMDLIWLNWNGSTKFEGKRVHWRLKRCHSNALSCNDTIRDGQCFYIRLYLSVYLSVWGLPWTYLELWNHEYSSKYNL
jgi:hypothetical protein